MRHATQRKNKADEEAEQWSRDFAKNLTDEIRVQPIGRAMALDERFKQEEEEKEIWEHFKAVYDPAKVSSKASTELQAAMNDMVAAWRELKDTDPTAKGRTFKIFSRNAPKPQNEEPAISSIREKYRNMCSHLDNYSGLFKFVPSGDKYVSLLTGTIETIVEATVNHTKIGKGFADSLDSISRELDYCSDSIRISRSKPQVDRDRVNTKVMEVFTACFKFLGPYARWCASRFERFMGSLNSNYYEDNVEGPLNALLARSKYLERENAMQDSQALNEIGRDMKELNKKQQARADIMSSTAQDVASIKATMESMQLELKKFRELGEKANGQNVLAAKKFMQTQATEQREKKAYFHWGKAFQGIKMGGVPQSTNPEATGPHSWDDIEAASHFLEAVADTGYPIDIRGLEDFNIAPNVFHPLEDWIMTQESGWLWMRGPLGNNELSEVSTAAYYTVMVSERLKIPLLSYRFRVDEFGVAESDDPNAEERSMEMDRFVLMTYSMIRQMVWLLPEKVETEIDLSPARFQSLDGSTKSLLDALNLIEELLSFMPQILVVVLDGFQFIDNDSGADGDSTHGYLELFLEILRSAGTNRALKVLITSDGLCRALIEDDVIHVDEQVHFGDEEEQVSGLFDPWIDDLSDEGISMNDMV